MVVSVTEISQPVHNVKMKFGVEVPMRDGVNLSTDIYMPDVTGTVPAILIRTPYNNNAEGVVEDCMYFASRGYAVVVQDARGRWDSDGEWYPFIHEAEDGFDTQEWIGSQPWCNGSVGTVGGSYGAMVQWQAAPLRSQYLKAMVPQVAYSNFYHNWVYTGGAFQLAFNLRWVAIQMHTRTNQVQYLWMPESNHLNTLHWNLPLIDMDEAAGRNSKVWKDWVNHPSYDDYWRGLRPTEELYAEIDVPAHGIGGWYDVFLQSTLNNFMGVNKQGRPPGKGNQRVTIGPWIHSCGNKGRETNRRSTANRRATLMERRSTLTREDWEAIKRSQAQRCAYCKKKRPLTIDHVIPLSKGGHHEATNVVAACKPCNSRKGDRILTLF